MGFLGGSDSKESACNAGDLDSVPGLGQSPGEENGYLPRYSCLEKSMNRQSLVGYSPWGHKALDTTKRLRLLYITKTSEDAQVFSVCCFTAVNLFTVAVRGSPRSTHPIASGLPKCQPGTFIFYIRTNGIFQTEIFK